jgi:uncharacterized membrane protein YhaH (DUF805 family)
MGVFKNQYNQVRSGWLILLLAIIILLIQLLLSIPFMKNIGTISSPLQSFALGMTTELALFLGVFIMWVLVQKKRLREIGLQGNGKMHSVD